YLRETIPPRNLTAPLLFISLACGILDATTYADFGTFASNQTGNTLILTLLLTSTPLPSSSNSAHILPTSVSLLSFLLFGFAFGHIGHYFGPRRRAWWLASLTVQLLAVLIPGVLLAMGEVKIAGQGGETEGNGKDWLILGLLAAGAGAQVGMARTSSNPEIPSAMLTSPLIDLLTDRHFFRPLFHPLARARNVRTLYVIALVGGSFLGAGIHKGSGTETVMWVSVGLR
ncbi:hypothetical protein BDY24DRAFT_329534, partial [Mrakia frigida]|uniref:YoaK family protein n=1 Tax=Mrakia frigida TaxID=29902 RepID=UPI003FCBFBA0